MKILVFEYLSGGGMSAEPLHPALVGEGDLMLQALLRDLSDLPKVRLFALRDARLPAPMGFPERVEWVPIFREDDAERRFRELIEKVEAVWPIAPETGGVLERLCAWTESAGKRLLTSPAAAVHLAASKLATAQRLQAMGVPAVPTRILDPAEVPAFPAVVKPDDGVGCEGARILAAQNDWQAFRCDQTGSETVIQPLVAGDTLSLSALFAKGQARLLACNRQHIARKGSGFVLRGCTVNAFRDVDGMFGDLVEQVGRALPELWGYAGIDLIGTDRGPLVLEINPRLTTSYAGLRASIGLNPAALVVEADRLGRLPGFTVRPATPVYVSVESAHEN